MKNWFKSYIIEVLPILTLFIYVGGFAYYIPYYYTFGINIINYISLTEILVLSVMPLFIAFAILSTSYLAMSCAYLTRKNSILKEVNKFIGYVPFYLKVPLKVKYINFKRKRDVCVGKKINRTESIKDASPKDQIYMLVAYLGFYIFGSILAVYLLERFFVKEYELTLFAKIIMGMGFFIMFFLGWVREIKNVKRKIVIKNVLIFSILVYSTALYIGLLFLGLHYGEEDIKNGASSEIEIIAKDSTQYVGKNQFLIGECNAAIFVYDRDYNRTVIFNKESIHRIVIFNSDSKINNIKDAFIKK